MIRLVILGGILFFWLLALSFLAICANDVILFEPGRERWFALLLNAIFLLLSSFFLFKFRDCFKLRPVAIWSVLFSFMILLILLGLWVPLVASVTGPLWEDKIVQIPFSACTPYMRSVWAWYEGDPDWEKNGH